MILQQLTEVECKKNHISKRAAHQRLLGAWLNGLVCYYCSAGVSFVE